MVIVMLNKLFEESYKQMYKHWVLHKVISDAKSIRFFYSLEEKFRSNPGELDLILPYFNSYFNNYLADEKLKGEFFSHYNKGCVFSFIKYIFDKEYILNNLPDNIELRASCYINHILEFLVSEYYFSEDGIKKENIIFDGSVSNDLLLKNIYNAHKYNQVVPYKFDLFFKGSAFEIKNYILPDYIWFLYFIKGVSLIEGKKVFTRYFEVDESQKKSVRFEKEDIYYFYSCLLHRIDDKYCNDASMLHGYYNETFEDLDGLCICDTFEENIGLMCYEARLSLSGLIANEKDILNSGDFTSPYYELFGDKVDRSWVM